MPDKLELPPLLLEEIRRGRVVLVLGSGASLGAKSTAGDSAPSSSELRDKLSDRFLGGAHKQESLAWVAELAISEANISAVQDFIAGLFKDLRPTHYQEALATFTWRGIATTNYDTLIETCYQLPQAVQQLIPILSDQDRVDARLHAPGSLAYLKLHGCISRTHDTKLRLILTTDQYITHRTGRDYLFTTLEQWAREHTLLFVGSGGQDPDIRELLLQVSEDLEERPRYYFLKPNASSAEQRLWESKRITVLGGTLEDFVARLDVAVPVAMRPLLKVMVPDAAIKRRFAVNEEISSTLDALLTNDLEYVHEAIVVPDGTPKAFYKGFDLGWYPIARDLDVRRKLTDQILIDIVVRAEAERPSPTELYAIKAEAGAGKSVVLRRLAWEAAMSAGALCLYLRTYGILSFDGIKELHRVTNQRIYLFVDDAAERVSELTRLLSRARQERFPLTVFTAERVNVWNMVCERLQAHVTDTYTLRYLSRQEITALVELLAQHNSLGSRLAKMTLDECAQEFEKRAGRQLLVALHEATLGLPFEEILLHEYSQIQPRKAQLLYLTVCTMNRFGVPVRAGLIARVHGVAFEEFRRDFLLPLEHVVKVEQNRATQDYLYQARHPEIAEIVFARVLASQGDRYNEYARIIAGLNLAYDTDRAALRGLLRAKSLHEAFPDHNDVKALFTIARRVGPREAFIYQQQANYERIRPSGNLGLAEELLKEARVLDPRDTTIQHTLAEVWRAKAEAATEHLEREKWRNEARGIVRPMLSDPQNTRYARHTLVKLAIDELKDVLGSNDAHDGEIDAAVRVVDDLLQSGLQEDPNDPLLLSTEADYSQMLNDDKRAFIALKRAFEANDRDTYIASRLARLQAERGELGEAEKTLARALEAKRGDLRLNFEYASVLGKMGRGDTATLVYHYRRAFTKWDTRYDAQFWFARHAYDSVDEGERVESAETFRRLRNAPLPFDARRAVRDVESKDGEPCILNGTVVRAEFTHGFVSRDGREEWVFFHKSESEVAEWERLKVGVRVRFELGFTFSGPIARHIVPV